MGLNNNFQILDENSLKELSKKIKNYIDLKDTSLDNDIKLNAQNILDENSRATTAENTLDSKIEGEISRSKVAEENLQGQLNTEIATRESEYTILDNKIESEDAIVTANLTAHVATEISSVTASISDLEIRLNEKIAVDIATSETGTKASITNLDTRVTTDINNIKNINTTHTSEIDVIKQNHSNHIENKSNPHGVTLEQLNAVSMLDFITLQQDLSIEKNKIDKNINDIGTLNTNVTDINSEISKLNTSIDTLDRITLRVEGNSQKLLGDLTIDKDESKNASGNLDVKGNLKIQGDLEVTGSTITTNVENQTLSVKDKFVTINSEGVTLESSIAGVAIRTNAEEAYGIAYSPENNSVALGKGVVDENNDFQFSSGEIKPILTRAESTQIENGHLLVWDAEKNIAIDGGSNNFETLNDQFKKEYTPISVHTEAFTQLSGNIQTTNDNLDKAKQDLNARIDSTNADVTALSEATDQEFQIAYNLLQPKQDDSLTTEKKTIPTAINELNTNIQNTQSDLNTHKIDKNNPHTVTWTQIHTQEGSGVYSDATPKMSSETGSVGVATSVSRSDHTHPIDTSRAPVDHSSTLPQYGKATNEIYGHVIVDDKISISSENPVQNKIVHEFVKDEINKLDVSEITLTADKTISSISETDGKISVTTQDIKISQGQVTDLDKSFEEVNGNISKLSNSLESTINDTVKPQLESLQKSITNEVSSRSQADIALNNAINDVETNYKDADTTLETNLKKDIADVNEKVDNIQLLDSKVKLSEIYRFTKPFGKYLPGTSGYVDVGQKKDENGNLLYEGEGETKKPSLMTIKELFLDAFQEASIGTEPDTPSYEFSISGSSNGEVGSSYTAPVATFKVTDVGSYQYGPATGITYNVTVSGGENENSATKSGLITNGTCQLTASEGGVYGTTSKTYTFKATYSYTEGAIPNTNIGTTDENKRIPAKASTEDTKTKTFNAGWREGCFYGHVTKADFTVDDIGSWLIRNLPNRLNANYSSKTDLTYQIPIGTTAFIIACPEGKTGPTSVYNSTVNAEMFNTDNFKTIEDGINVGGADATEQNPVGEYPANYNVWYYIPANAYSSTADLKIDLG